MYVVWWNDVIFTDIQYRELLVFRGPPESISRLSVGLMCSHSPLDECVGKGSGQRYVNVRVLYSVCFHCIILHILGVYLVTLTSALPLPSLIHSAALPIGMAPLTSSLCWRPTQRSSSVSSTYSNRAGHKWTSTLQRRMLLHSTLTASSRTKWWVW